MSASGFPAFDRLPAMANLVVRALCAVASASSATYAAEAGSDRGPEYHETAPGLLERPVYRSPDARGAPVEVVDVLVGPRRIAGRVTVETGTLLDIQSGAATLSIGGRKQEVRPGRVIALPPGQTFLIDNRKQERPFVARLIRLAGPTP